MKNTALKDDVLEGTIKTYVISSYAAESLVEVVRPMLPQGGSVLAYQGKLIIRTTPSSFRGISQLLAQVDKLPKSLKLSLRVAESSSARRTQVGGSAVVLASKKAGVKLGSTVDISATAERSQLSSLYIIKALSGYPARIDSGTLLELSRGVWGAALVPVTTGLEVVPLSLPNSQVKLTVSQHYDRNRYDFAEPAAQTESTQTQVIAPLGQWVSIGSITQSRSHTSHSMFGRDASSAYIQLPLEVKVDALP